MQILSEGAYKRLCIDSNTLLKKSQESGLEIRNFQRVCDTIGGKNHGKEKF